MTSSLKPVKTREVYASFRARYGKDTQSLKSVPLRKVTLSICDNVAGIEYFLQSDSPPSESCQSTTPFTSEMMPSGTLDQEKFVLAGEVTIFGKTVYYYTNRIPKNYRRRPDKEGSDEEDGDGEGGAGGECDINDIIMKPIFSRRYVTFLTAFKPLLFGTLLMPIILA